MMPGVPLTIAETGRLIAAYEHVSRRLFETLGALVPAVDDPELKVAVAAHARAHAWHAELWADQRPVGVAAGDPGDSSRFDAALGRLPIAAYYRLVLPRLIVAHDRHLAHCSPVADGALARVLRIVVADEVEMWREGEGHLVRTQAGYGEIDEIALAWPDF